MSVLLLRDVPETYKFAPRVDRKSIVLRASTVLGEAGIAEINSAAMTNDEVTLWDNVNFRLKSAGVSNLELQVLNGANRGVGGALKAVILDEQLNHTGINNLVLSDTLYAEGGVRASGDSTFGSDLNVAGSLFLSHNFNVGGFVNSNLRLSAGSILTSRLNTSDYAVVARSGANLLLGNYTDALSLLSPTDLVHRRSTSVAHKIWDAGNMGHTSGLDADTLDSVHAASFLRSDVDAVMNANLLYVYGKYEGYRDSAGVLQYMIFLSSSNELVFYDAVDNLSTLVLSAASATVNGNASVTGGMFVGSTSKAANTVVRALSGDGYTAGFEAYGGNQGTGYMFVGQSSLYGGGVLYNGDGAPASNTTTDHVSFFRRDNGTDIEVFRYGYGSSVVTFLDSVAVRPSNTDGLFLYPATGRGYSKLSFVSVSDASTGALHCFHTDWYPTDRMRSWASLNINGMRGVTLGSWDSPVVVVDDTNKRVGVCRTPLAPLDVVGATNSDSFAINYKTAFTEHGTTWLGININAPFTSGVYFGTGVVRHDGNFQIGAGGSVLSVTSAGMTLGTPLAVASGGTGANTVAGARTNMSVYSKAESDTRYGRRLIYSGRVSHPNANADNAPTLFQLENVGGAAFVLTKNSRGIYNLSHNLYSGLGIGYATLFVDSMTTRGYQENGDSGINTVCIKQVHVSDGTISLYSADDASANDCDFTFNVWQYV